MYDSFVSVVKEFSMRSTGAGAYNIAEAELKMKNEYSLVFGMLPSSR